MPANPLISWPPCNNLNKNGIHRGRLAALDKKITPPWFSGWSLSACQRLREPRPVTKKRTKTGWGLRFPNFRPNSAFGPGAQGLLRWMTIQSPGKFGIYVAEMIHIHPD